MNSVMNAYLLIINQNEAIIIKAEAKCKLKY